MNVKLITSASDIPMHRPEYCKNYKCRNVLTIEPNKKQNMKEKANLCKSMIQWKLTEYKGILMTRIVLEILSASAWGKHYYP